MSITYSKSVRKPFYIFLLLILLVSKGIGQKLTVHYPASFPKEVAEDIRTLLEQASGKSWNVSASLADSLYAFNLVRNPARNYKTGESAYIVSDGTSFVRIEAGTTNGLIFGAYKYLRGIGFKFYLPDELYTELPAHQTIFRKTASMETPSLKIREFFGTGGFGSGKTDPANTVQKAWQLWKRRNGFGADFHLDGHVGETFNLDNADKLEKNPQWTATSIKTKGQVNQNTRLNYFNNEAVDFFTNWVIRKYTAKGYVPPPAYVTDMVSIEPADGGTYTGVIPANSRLKTTSPSDQVFYAANIAAEKLDKLFPNHPNIGVNLYAYSDHAEVPSFPLNKRVFVQIIPYQFQNVAYGPAFIKRWSSTVKRFAVYDYYKYTDATWDLPGGFTLAELMNRAIYTKTAGSEGTTYESSYSKFSTAIPLWILIRFMADGDAAWEKNYSDLIQDLYQESKNPVKKIFDLFYKTPQFSQLQMPVVFQLMNEAENRAKSVVVQKRLAELKQYVTYISLYYQMQNGTATSLETNLLPIAQMAYTLYQSKVIHSYRIMQLVSYGFLNANPESAVLKSRYQQLHLQTFPDSDDPSAFWRKDWKYNQTEMENIYKKNAQLKFSTAVTAIPQVSLPQQIQISKKNFRPKQEVTIQSDYTVRGYISLFAEQSATIDITWTLKTTDKQLPALTISGMDADYKNIYDLRLKGTSGKLQLTIPKGETFLFMNANNNTTYRIIAKLNGAYAFFEGSPRGKMNFVLNETATYEAPIYPSYFYVPANQEAVQYKVQGNALQIFDPENKPVKTTLISTEGGFEIRQFLVPVNFRNNYYNLHITGNYDYQLLNVPERYFLLEKK